MQQWKQDMLTIKKFDTRAEMGMGAAVDAEKVISQIISEKGEINMIFAAAPSQNEMLEGLLSGDKIDWSKVNALHMDEYVGIAENHPESYHSFMWNNFFNHICKEISC